MASKRLAQIGAAVSVGLAVAMTLVHLQEEPAPQTRSQLSGREADTDALAIQLRACTEMGEQALSEPGCRAAWAEKRRRFFGVAHPDAYGEPRMTSAPGSPEADVTASGSN